MENSKLSHYQNLRRSENGMGCRTSGIARELSSLWVVLRIRSTVERRHT